jgi:hypothetical protein
MSGVAADDLQSAIDFLLRLEPEQVEWAGLSNSADYGAIVRMARNRECIETNGSRLREAFALIMQARLVASSQLAEP